MIAEASHCAEALERASAVPPDGIIIDLRVVLTRSPHELLRAVRAVASGQQHVDPVLTHHLAAPFTRVRNATLRFESLRSPTVSRGYPTGLPRPQQQGNCGTVGLERQNNRIAQGQRDAKAWPSKGESSCRRTPIRRLPNAAPTSTCLETQHFPNSPNRPDCPPTILRAGQRHESLTTWTFSVDATTAGDPSDSGPLPSLRQTPSISTVAA
jgi:hypothetical protein